MNREEFRLDRVAVMDEVSLRLKPTVQNYLNGELSEDELYLAIETEFVRVWEADFGLTDNWRDAWDWFKDRIRPGIDAIGGSTVASTVADWLGTATVNGGRIARTTNSRVWLSRRDNRVRTTHREADGQEVGDQEPFVVCGGVQMMFPGEPVGPPECWINCRCVAAPANLAAAADGNGIVASVDEHAESGHDLVWCEGRRTPEVVRKGQPSKKCGPDKAAGKVVKRRAATADEEKTIRDGGWVRVSPSGKTPSDPGYKESKKSKIRPQNNSLEGDMTITEDDVAAFAPGDRPDDDTIDVEGVDDDMLDDEDWEWDDDELGGGMEDGDFGVIPDMIPWYGVLAPEGERSGDGRRFSPDALTHRDLPLPFRWQESDTGGHDGAITIGTIDNIWRQDGLYMGSGLLLDSQEADTFVGQVMVGAARGISVDVDDAELAAEPGEDGEVEFAKGRVCAATAVAIPAFPQAFLALGEYRGGESETDEYKDYTPEQRRRAEDKGNAMPGGSYPINDCEDLRNAIQAIGRASDPDKVKAHIRKRKRELGCEEVELPDTWALTAGGHEFKRGPGWVTNPTETRRLHHYWTKGKGAAKIRWGTPGDFRRLRRALAKYINPIYLNRTVAQWHKDALGYWPGECGKPGNPPCGESRVASADVESVHLVAAAMPEPLPWELFSDPGFDTVTPMTVKEQAGHTRIYGHLAPWDQCHIGIQNVCTRAPKSQHNYAYFHTGAVYTDEGWLAAGVLTYNTGHAGGDLSAKATVAHYDDTGTVAADIVCGEDDYGIWFSGAVRDGADVATVMAAPPSGDWRAIGGSLELVGALAVNVQGFPIPRTEMAVQQGVQTSLIVFGTQPVVQVDGAPVDDSIVEAVVAALEARTEKRGKVAEASSVIREERLRLLSDMMCNEPACAKEGGQ